MHLVALSPRLWWYQQTPVLMRARRSTRARKKARVSRPWVFQSCEHLRDALDFVALGSEFHERNQFFLLHLGLEALGPSCRWQRSNFHYPIHQGSEIVKRDVSGTCQHPVRISW